MSEPRYRYLQTRTERRVLVLTPTPKELKGDEIAQQLTDDMLKAVEHAGARDVVVNFEHIEFLTSANFRPLLALRKKLLEKSGQVVLCGLTPVLQDIFEATRMIGSGGSASSRVLFAARPDVDAAATHVLELQGSAGNAPKP